ncbi:CobW family GTP-binding protein [Desulfovibrio inopinatus]|uniref:CobW family GTP-binding protein n=1 Tax=Desulfovibrio inopinatus TaxID=102109 RepID=UPI00041D7A82|nr:GTP-binding protein [Desulfovibrio inopinatus]
MSQIPVTVLTGYLGAGKTTLLNRILSENHGRRFAVIVNEFGELGIDAGLVVDAQEEIYEMNNGCVCCNVRGDLIRIVNGLIKRRGRFDGILVETTGLAEPAPVIQTFYMDDETRERTKLDAIVTVVDAHHFSDQSKRCKEVVRQVVYANVVLVNKIDLIDDETLQTCLDNIRSINPGAEIITTTRCDAPIASLLDKDAFDITKVMANDPFFLMPDGHVHDHGDDLKSISLSVPGAVDLDAFQQFIGKVLEEQGQDILRSKGILEIADSDLRFVFQGVHMLAEMSYGAPWKEEEPRGSRVVFIGRGLDKDALTAAFTACTNPVEANA